MTVCMGSTESGLYWLNLGVLRQPRHVEVRVELRSRCRPPRLRSSHYTPDWRHSPLHWRRRWARPRCPWPPAPPSPAGSSLSSLAWVDSLKLQITTWHVWKDERLLHFNAPLKKHYHYLMVILSRASGVFKQYWNYWIYDWFLCT